MSFGACDPHGISYAWIDPHGKVHETVHGHEDWAWRFIAAFPDMLLEAKMRNDAGAVLLQRGWIRVANFTNMSVWHERTPSAAAVDAMVDLVVTCSVRHRDIDPFEPLIYVEETGSGGQAEVYSIADFLEKFAGKRESELFFESLMSRTASGQACSVIATSWAWVDPFGKLYIVRQTHEEWAARYVQQPQEARAYRDWLKVHPSKEGGVSRYLLRTGWIRATNAYALEVGVPHRVSEAAWKVVADNLIACALQRGIDPEAPAAVLVATENGENVQHSVAEFVERYGNAQQLTRLLEGALKNRRFARTDVVGKPLVERLRKDVLMLAKAAESVRTLEEAQAVKKGLSRWLVSYERLLAGIREDLEGRIREAKAYAQTGYKGSRPVSDVERAQWHLDNMRPVWILRSEISSGLRVPELKSSGGGSFEEPASVRDRIIDFYREKYPEKDAEGETDSYLSRNPPWTRQQAEQAAVAQWAKVAVPWARRVREKAREAWAYLHDLSAWTELESGSGGGGSDPVKVVMPEDEHIILEGFKVVFQGFAESGSDRQEALEKLKGALRRYRKNVSDRLPLILRKQLPFVVEWVFDPGAHSDYAGQYHVDHIRLSPWAFASDVDRTVHVLVHEMGHHLYRTVLSDSATQFWNTAVKGDYGDLDLRHALKVLESLGITYSEDKVLAEADPVLYLQFGTLQNDITYKNLDLWDVNSIREYIEAGNNPVVRVPHSPITGYSGKNSEEAFCEAVARLVAYGPMTLPDKVLGWLKVVLPNIRIGSEQSKVAARPIKVDRQAVVGLTHRLIDQMREEGRGRENERVGVQEAILMDTVHVLTVEGQKKEVTVILTSGKGSARRFISGGGFGTVKEGPHKGTPIIIVQLDGRETWGTYGDFKTVGFAFMSTLMHEITHAMDKVVVKETDPTFQGGVIPNASDLDLNAYYNQPNEVRAYMRELFEELRPLVTQILTHEKYRKDWTLAETITKVIGGIDRWRRMKPYLTQQNRNRILKGIVTAFEDEGLGKTAGIRLTLKPGRSSNASAFLSDYDALTYGNPIDDRVRVWSYVSDDGERVPLITTELQSTPHQEAPIWLKSIASPERQGSGQASYVLKEIARLADKHGVAIWLTPKPFGSLPNGLKMADLKGWYRRHGWVPKGSVWIREPVTSPTDRVASAWLARTAARPRYQEKKEVPKADGSGTATVYVYSDRQVANRHRDKAERVEGLRGKIGDLRKRVKKDLKSDDPSSRLTALAVALIDETYERVGNDTSADNGHYGVTGWTMDHVSFSKDGKRATFRYVGKSGVEHEKTVEDAAILSALKACCGKKAKTDPVLSDGDVRITSRMVNEYLREFDITAKDLRGYHANREMQERLRAIRSKGSKLPKPRKERDAILKDEFKQALEGAAEAVGHEAATLRTQYLVPGIERAYMKDGSVPRDLTASMDIDRLDKVASASDDASGGFHAFPYFAYGSNLNPSRIQHRAPNSVPWIGAKAPGYKAKFVNVNGDGSDGKMTITPSEGASVRGFLFHIPKDEMSDLDDWEHVSGGHYQRIHLDVHSDEGHVGKAFTYVAQSSEGAHPSTDYTTKVRDGQRAWDIPLVDRKATKTHAEREDDEAARLVRRTPKLKPSRNDSKRERMEVNDPDIEGRDKDLSLNHKDIG